MRITLISPYPEIQAFGIRTISACLKKEGYDVRVIFLPRCFVDRYEDKTLKEVIELCIGSSFIGISLMTNFFDNVAQITQRLKNELNCHVLWGGVHPTMRPEECLNYADMVCIGEGEETIVALAGRIESGQGYNDVQGLWIKDKGKLITNKIRPLIQNLDSIPFQDYDCLNHWILDGRGVYRFGKALLQKYTERTYLTMPTRGCPFGCSYCCNNRINEMYPGQTVRKRSIDNVIKELIQIKNALPFIEHIKFDDDAFFMYNVDQTKEFSERYKKNIGLPLTITGITPTTFTREKFSLLVDAGLSTVRMGIETGSERTKKLYKRHYSNQQVEEAVRIINEFKNKIVRPCYDIILDNPWETDEDLIATLMLLAKLPSPYELILYSMAFYPGTELYRMAKMDGLIVDDLKDVYRKYFHNCKKNYLNGLFFLLQKYSRGGGRISPKVMTLLTGQKMRQSRLNWVLLIMLNIGAIPSRMRWIKYLLYEGLKDILWGNWVRITWHVKRRRWANRMECG